MAVLVRTLIAALSDIAESPRRPIVGMIAMCANVLALVTIGSLTAHLNRIVANAHSASAGRIVVAIDREILGVERAHDQLQLSIDRLRRLPSVSEVKPLVLMPYRLEIDRTRLGPPEVIAGDDAALRRCDGVRTPSRSAVLGADFAALEGLGPGDAVSLYGNLFWVCAVAPRGYTFKDQAVIIAEKAARRLVPQILPHTAVENPSPSDAVTALEVRVREDETIDDVIATANTMPHLTAHDPRDQARLQSSVLGVFHLIAFGIVLVTIVTSCISIGNVAAASVMERSVEIGLRRAVGATRTDVFLEVTVAAIVVGCSGGVAGLVMASCVPLAIKPLETTLGTLGLFDVDPGSAFAALGFVLGVSTVASLGPALRAAALQPAAVLRKP